MKKLNKEQLEMILKQITTLQQDHPKAEIFYDTEVQAIQIIYSLPKNFYTLRSLKTCDQL